MTKIYFATTNEGKLKEARQILNIEIESAGMEVEEVQSLDPQEVASKKARAYYEVLKKPILVEDVSLVFKALNKLPGTYINDFSKTLGNDGMIKLILTEQSREAVAQTTLVFIDEQGTEHVFEGITEGTITTEQRGNKGFGWDPIFVPLGQEKTFAEMDDTEKNNYSMRGKAFELFRQWLVKK